MDERTRVILEQSFFIKRFPEQFGIFDVEGKQVGPLFYDRKDVDQMVKFLVKEFRNSGYTHGKITNISG